MTRVSCSLSLQVISGVDFTAVENGVMPPRRWENEEMDWEMLIKGC